MMGIYAAVVTLLGSLAIIALWFFVSRKRFPAADVNTSTPTVYRVRSVYFWLILGVTIIVLAFTLPMTPYATTDSKSKPNLIVTVLGEMWSWTLTPGPGVASAEDGLVLPVGKEIGFDVTSKDVNHNFAIYNSMGELVAQVQAMPDYTNRLIHKFTVPGHYYVLCLEYCGLAHHLMSAEFEVK